MLEKDSTNGKEFDEIYGYWKIHASRINKKLLGDLEIESIDFTYELNGEAIKGYDWINKIDYQKRIDFVINKPVQFLLVGEFENKGTLRTVELLDTFKRNNEEIATIWLLAFIKEIEDVLPRNWHGEQYRMIKNIEIILSERLPRAQYYLWHHAMKKLLPEIIFSNFLLESMTLEACSEFIELAVLNISHIVNSYSAVHYDSTN